MLALVNDERGADAVADALDGAALATPNLAEVFGKPVDAGVDTTRLTGLPEAAGVVFEPCTTDDAVLGRGAALSSGRSRAVTRRPLLPRSRTARR